MLSIRKTISFRQNRLSLAITFVCLLYVLGMIAINLYSDTHSTHKRIYVTELPDLQIQLHSTTTTAAAAATTTAAASVSSSASSNLSSFDKSFCPVNGEKLVGSLRVDINKMVQEAANIDNLSIKNGGKVHLGGWWRPEHCKPKYKVAFLLPYRNRELQLKMFLYHMTPILQRQLLEYRMFVIEQTGKTAFNKGAIYNIGFNSTLQFGEFDCYIFHDVDLLLENDKNYHGCAASPVHLAPAVNTLNYRLFAPGHFGGIELFTREHYEKINGFTNMFWGWGAEDDDLYLRVDAKGLKIIRPPLEFGRYTMNQQKHFRSDPYNDKNARLVRKAKTRQANMDNDGLRQISKLSFTQTVEEMPLFTKISIDLRHS
ncbi:beta-1,4-galactosyltransferase 5-like [Rhopilema esculentum]|uniref:beta-1,4-galactosyltransferase 5-like n=1 Tax=Rhopilema esculentum TaxID=499914 RepID=UPI0031E26365